jgi:hypothetical protein
LHGLELLAAERFQLLPAVANIVIVSAQFGLVPLELGRQSLDPGLDLLEPFSVAGRPSLDLAELAVQLLRLGVLTLGDIL